MSESLIGTKIGTVQIERELGHLTPSIMWWEGRDANTQVLRWVLGLSPQFRGEAEWEEAWVKSGSATHSCFHRYVLSGVEKVFLEGEGTFFVYEAMPGTQSLKEWGGKLTSSQLEKIFVALADVIEETHFKSISNSFELNPEFVFVVVEEDIVLVRCLLVPQLNTASHPAQTQAGIVKGDFRYMSPESVQGKDRTRESDYFTLGSMLVEAATGQRAFQDDTELKVLQNILEGSSSTLQDADIDPGLRSLAQDLLQPNQEQRLSDPNVFKSRLRLATKSRKQETLLQEEVAEEEEAFLDSSRGGGGGKGGEDLGGLGAQMDAMEIDTILSGARQEPAEEKKQSKREKRELRKRKKLGKRSQLSEEAPEGEVMRGITLPAPEPAPSTESERSPEPVIESKPAARPEAPSSGAAPSKPPMVGGSLSPSPAPPPGAPPTTTPLPPPSFSASAPSPQAPMPQAPAPSPQASVAPPAPPQPEPTAVPKATDKAEPIQGAAPPAPRRRSAAAPPKPKPVLRSRDVSLEVTVEQTESVTISLDIPEEPVAAGPGFGGVADEREASKKESKADLSQDRLERLEEVVKEALEPLEDIVQEADDAFLGIDFDEHDEGAFGNAGADDDDAEELYGSVVVQDQADGSEELEVKVLRRKGVVRNYTQMNPGKIFPLLVSIVEAAMYIKVPDLPEVQQVESDQVMEIKESSPYVRIVPVLPGCLISPPEAIVDVRKEKVDVEFWVAPQAEGDLTRSARIQIWHDGILKDEIPIPCQVVTQTLTKVASYSSVLSSFGGALLETYGQKLMPPADTLNSEAPSMVAVFVQQVVSMLSSSGIWLGVFFLFTAFLCYLWLRPKRGDVIERFLTTDLH